jgi:hypothetical protein
VKAAAVVKVPAFLFEKPTKDKVLDIFITF